MKITPRRNEYAAVVELLESDAYDRAETLAKDIVKAVWAELMKRDLWLAVNQPFPGLTTGFGPFTSESDAKGFVKHAELTGLNVLLPMFSPAGVLERHDERQATEDQIKDGGAICRCGCPKFVHEHHGYGGKCAARDCRCNRFTEQENAA